MGESTAARRLSVNFDGPMCPATGKVQKNCPGYVLDHVIPLECGGLDSPDNLQFQTVADAKAKDRTESLCRK
jgi:hypothetical protein